MEDLKKIQEFFSKDLNEISKEDAWKEFQEKRHVTDKTTAVARKDFDKGWDEGKFKDGNYKSLEESEFSPIGYARKVYKNMMSLADAAKEANISQTQLLKLVRDNFDKDFKMTFEAETNASEDIPDIIAVDVPLFIRLLEFAREDAGDDMDLHEVAERAIEAVKMRGVLSMDDYETLVPPKEELDEKMLVPKDKIDRMARDIAAKYFASKTDKADAIEILRKAVEDSYKALDPEVEIREEEGYSKFLKDDPDYPGGKTPGLTSDVMDRILQKIMKDVDETKRPGLWDNIRAQKERGEKPARKGSKEYKAAVAAGKRINKEK